MIYLIGGAPRIGKTTLSKIILERNKIPYMPTDLIRGALYKFLNKDLGKWQDRPEFFFPYLADFIRRIDKEYKHDYVIEGDIFLPEQIASLEQSKIKCVFLGSSNITLDQIKDNDSDSWVHTMDVTRQNDLPNFIMEKSNMFKEEANKYGFAYFDIYPDRNKALEAAYEYLFK